MTFTRRLLCTGLAVSAAFVFLAPLPAQNPDSQSTPAAAGKFRILDTVRAKTIQQELDTAAAEGFRVVSGDAGYKILLLEKDPAGTRAEYVFSDSVDRLVEKGQSQGYRILPFSFAAGLHSVGAVLEKLAAGEPQSEYHVLSTVQTRNFQKDMNEWSGKGFQLVAFSGSARNYGLMEKPAGAAPAGPTDRYLLLATSRTGTLEKEITDAVAGGYRVLFATGAKKEILVVLEKLAPGEAAPRYRLVSTARSGTLEREIAAAGRDGYRLLPMTLCALAKSGGILGTIGYEIAAIMEKKPGSPSAQYKMLSTRRVPTLQKELAEMNLEGWSLTRLFLSYEEQILIFER